MAETSKLWPLIRAIGKALTIPGTNIGPGILVEMQDKLSSDESSRQIKAALNEINSNLEEVTKSLRREKLNIQKDDLVAATIDIATQVYLAKVATSYLYADFKGIEQLEKLVPLKLDEVFVDLKIRRQQVDMPIDGNSNKAQSPSVSTIPAAENLEPSPSKDKLSQRSSRPCGIDEVIGESSATIILGGPGSGKTTLVKRLARSFGLGETELRKRYPQLTWHFPIVIPAAQFKQQHGTLCLYEYTRSTLEDIGGHALVTAFEEHWNLGTSIILIDGLDEIADASARIACARHIDYLIQEAGANKIVITSRAVGYNICRVSVPATHVTMEPFTRPDIELFVRQWYRAYETAVRSENPNLSAVDEESRALIKEIELNPRVESLATNPLMLTIISLIKHQNITLPERRVELYEIALNTLIRSWNKARSLANQPIGTDISAEETKKVWSRIAFWMHSEKSSGTCSRYELQERLSEILREIIPNKGEVAATKIAESYIRAAAERAGLLEERGADVFAFMHQTFQEYLAANYLVLQRPYTQVLQRFHTKIDDPRWYEVIRLSAGFIGVIQRMEEVASEVVLSLAEANSPVDEQFPSSILLAASCIGDDVGISNADCNRVLKLICNRLHRPTRPLLATALSDGLKSLKRIVPDEECFDQLLLLRNHSNWRIRMEAVRLANRAAVDQKKILAFVQDMLDDADPDVRYHVAYTMWKAGIQTKPIAISVLRGITSPFTQNDRPDPETTYAACKKVLKSGKVKEAATVAHVVGELPLNESSALLVIELLNSPDQSIVLTTLESVHRFSHSKSVIEALKGLMNSRDTKVRLNAACLCWDLNKKRSQEVIQDLAATTSEVAVAAARFLDRQGIKSSAEKALRSLSDKPGAIGLTSNAALCALGHINAIPKFFGLFAHAKGRDAYSIDLDDTLSSGPTSTIVNHAATLLQSKPGPATSAMIMHLGSWPKIPELVESLERLLRIKTANIGFYAAQVLKRWGCNTKVHPWISKLASRKKLSDFQAYLVATSLDPSIAAEFVVERIARNNNFINTFGPEDIAMLPREDDVRKLLEILRNDASTAHA